MVSVIIPTRNRSIILKRAIASVLNQTFTDLECLVVNDCSDDDTLKLLSSIPDPRVRVFNHTMSKGASASRNLGLQNSSGDYITFLDDDDEWLPSKLEKQVSLFNSLSPDWGLIYNWMDHYLSNNILANQTHPIFEGEIFIPMLDGNIIAGTSTLMIRREVYLDLGGFDENLSWGDDYEFSLRISRKYKIKVIKEVLTKIFNDPGYPGISARSFQGIMDNISGIKYILKKYQADYSGHRYEKGHMLAKVAVLYAKIKSIRGLSEYTLKAFLTDPFHYGKFRKILRSCKYLIN